MKSKFSILAFIAVILMLFSAAHADPIEQPYKGADKITVLKTSKAGLKVYDVEPKDDLNSFDWYFINKGNIKVPPSDVGKQIPVFKPEDVKKFALHCDYLCADADGNIVGRVFDAKADARLAKK